MDFRNKCISFQIFKVLLRGVLFISQFLDPSSLGFNDILLLFELLQGSLFTEDSFASLHFLVCLLLRFVNYSGDFSIDGLSRFLHELVVVEEFKCFGGLECLWNLRLIKTKLIFFCQKIFSFLHFLIDIHLQVINNCINLEL